MNQLAQTLHIQSRWMPWLWIGLLIAAGIEINIFANLALWAIGLVIPIAALLGWSYGHRGVAIVALGGLPLLFAWRYGVLAGGMSLDLYLAALVVCALAASTWQGGPILRVRFWPDLILALLLLPLSAGLYANDADTFQYQIVLQFMAILYLLLFLLGVARYPKRLAIATLAAFSAFGIVLELLQLPNNAQELLGGPYAELTLFGYTQLRTLWLEYSLDSPAMFFTAVGWFVAGHQVALLYETGESAALPWYRSYLPIILLAVVGLGWETNAYLANTFTGASPSPAFTLFGSFHALQCAAFMGGLLLRWRGVWLVSILLAMFLLLDGLLRADFDIIDASFAFYLGEPIAVLGFGALGIALRNRVLGTNTVWWSWRWATYVLIMAAVLPALFSLDSALDLLWMVLGMITSVVIAQLLVAARKRYLGWLPTHGGWLALLGLVASIIIGVRGGREYFVQLYTTVGEWIAENIASINAGEGWYEPDGEVVIALMALLISCAVFFTILLQYLRNAPAFQRDLNVLIAMVQGKTLPATDSALQQAGVMNPTRESLRSLAIKLAAVTRTVTIVMIIAVVLIQAVVQFYPQDGIKATIQAWFTAEPAEPTAYDIDTVAADAEINPWLWQAVRETFAQMPGTVDEREGTLTTEWYSIENEPGIRQRLDIQVGETLEAYALEVNLRRQQKGLFGLWIEQASYWDPRKGEFVGHDPYAQQQEIAGRLLARAQELARAAAD